MPRVSCIRRQAENTISLRVRLDLSPQIGLPITSIDVDFSAKKSPIIKDKGALELKILSISIGKARGK